VSTSYYLRVVLDVMQAQDIQTNGTAQFSQSAKNMCDSGVAVVLLKVDRGDGGERAGEGTQTS
jgi:hypothetical protein